MAQYLIRHGRVTFRRREPGSFRCFLSVPTRCGFAATWRVGSAFLYRKYTQTFGIITEGAVFFFFEEEDIFSISLPSRSSDKVIQIFKNLSNNKK